MDQSYLNNFAIYIRHSLLQIKNKLYNIMKRNSKQPIKRSTRSNKPKVSSQDSNQQEEPYLQDASIKEESSISQKKKKKIIESDEADNQQQQSDDQEDQQSDQSIQPKQIAIKNMTFRSRRGQKMNYLINRKKEQDEESDEFWKNNKYFGDQKEANHEDQEDYVESSSGKDEFDSDFLSDQKEKQLEKQDEQEYVEEPQEESKKRKRIDDFQIPKKPAKKIKKPQVDQSFKYIHQQYSQQLLLAEAAHTEYHNMLSLQQLISLEQEKKVYESRNHTLDPPKIVFKDSMRTGKREYTIQLVGFEKNISLFDLSDKII